MLAVLRILKVFEPIMVGKVVQVIIDRSTMMYLYKQGGTPFCGLATAVVVHISGSGASRDILPLCLATFPVKTTILHWS